MTGMAKYQVPRKTYLLLLEDHPGMEVRASSVSFGQLLSVADAADRARAGAGLAETRELFELFASKLVDWNLTDELEQDIPLTVNGLFSLDADLVQALALAWFGAMVEVDESLGKGSTSGAPSPEASIPMETL